MDVSQFLTGTFMNAADLSGQPPQNYTIKKVEKKELQGEPKLVVSFHETEKELTLNKTRLKTLVSIFGPETAAWMNQKISLFSQPIVSGKFAGQSTITVMQGQQQPTQPVQQPAQQQEVAFKVE